jgi:hypothetical protein
MDRDREMPQRGHTLDDLGESGRRPLLARPTCPGMHD